MWTEGCDLIVWACLLSVFWKVKDFEVLKSILPLLSIEWIIRSLVFLHSLSWLQHFLFLCCFQTSQKHETPSLTRAPMCQRALPLTVIANSGMPLVLLPDWSRLSSLGSCEGARLLLLCFRGAPVQLHFSAVDWCSRCRVLVGLASTESPPTSLLMLCLGGWKPIRRGPARCSTLSSRLLICLLFPYSPLRDTAGHPIQPRSIIHSARTLYHTLFFFK